MAATVRVFAFGASDVVKPGENVIAVKVFDNQAVGGIWKPVKLMAQK